VSQHSWDLCSRPAKVVPQRHCAQIDDSVAVVRGTKSTLLFPSSFLYSPKFSVSRLFCSPLAFTLVSCSAYSTLKMEVICSSEMSVGFQRTTGRYIPEDNTLQKIRKLHLRPDYIVWECFLSVLISKGVSFISCVSV
jgi:hypothetical protein